MEYSDGLKQRILESRHQFIYGEQKERSAYLKSLSNCSYLENGKKTIPIYTDFGGFADTNNLECEKDLLRSIHNDYFALYMASLIFDRLKFELPEDELFQLERSLKELFFEASVSDLDILKKELEIGMMANKELYEHYIKKGELKSNLFDDVKLSYLMLDMLLPELKQVVPSLAEFIFIVDKTTYFGTVYTSVINTYIASRSNGYLSMKIVCENNNDWKNYYTVNGESIEDTHDYSIIRMDDYKLSRLKKD